MGLKATVLGTGLLIAGCETNPCIKAITSVQDGSRSAWNNECTDAKTELKSAETAQKECLGNSGLDLSNVTQHLRNLIRQICETK